MEFNPKRERNRARLLRRRASSYIRSFCLSLSLCLLSLSKVCLSVSLSKVSRSTPTATDKNKTGKEEREKEKLSHLGSEHREKKNQLHQKLNTTKPNTQKTLLSLR